MRRYLQFVPIVVLIIITVLSVFIGSGTDQSKALTVEKTKTESQTRSDYVDSDGRITFVSDKGYASVLETKVSDQESVIQYLDENGEPVVLSAGYNTIHRTYTSAGKAETDTYFIGDTQVQRKQGYWQYHRIYGTEGKICEVQYLDQEGNLIKNKSGYARILRTYTKAGRIDIYQDEQGKPTAASIGQFGVRKVGDTTTYLDADGNPMDTTRGYAIVKKDGNKTLYYDKNGEPVTVGRGQYGVEKDEDGQSIYLDEEGVRMFRIDNFLHTHPFIVVLLGIAATVAAVMVRKKAWIIFLIAYVLFIGVMTIAYRESGDSHGQFILFHSYRLFFTKASVRQNILNNIWLFVPLGAVLYSMKRKWAWILFVALSILIEAIQYFAGIGLCEIDDVISNSMGGFIGCGFAAAISMWKDIGKNTRSIKAEQSDS